MTTVTHTQPRNADRQKAAYETLFYYAATKGLLDANIDADLEGHITDLLTDLRHLCGARGIDFDARVNTSADHYTAELAGLDE